MRTPPLSLAILTFLLFKSGFSIKAQDSTKIDLGNMVIDSRFTQHITIKGEDLQKLPFARLEEALAIYTRGIFTYNNNITYIIDGNINENVDAVSIYDIENITIMWSAIRLVNGAVGPQQFVLVKTKTDRSGKTGVTASANVYLTKSRDFPSGKYIPDQRATFFHQHYLSAYKAFAKSNIGVSANFQHQAYLPPEMGTGRIYDPQKSTRFRFYGWYNTDVGNSSSLSIRVNVSPENSMTQYSVNDAQAGNEGSFNNESRQLVINPTVRFQTKITRSWSNEFNASYLHKNITEDYDFVYEATQQQIITTSTEHTKGKLPGIFLRDRISYKKEAGNWSFTPSLTLFYNESRHTSRSRSAMLSTNGGPVSLSESKWRERKREVAATPLFNMVYKNVLSLDAGVQFNAYRRPYLGTENSDLYPFANISFDIIKAINAESATGLKFFGSYAKAASRMYETFLPNLVIYRYQGGVFIPITIGQELPGDEPSTSFALGICLSALNEQFSISYNYERQRYWEIEPMSLLPAGERLLTQDSDADVHRFTANYRTKEKSQVRYRTSLNVFMAEYTKVSVDRFAPPTGYVITTMKPDWTGGWTHAVEVNKFTGGVTLYFNYNADLRYQLLQNLYFGYKINVDKKPGEIYLSTRNLVQKKNSSVTDGLVAYLGGGVKVAL